MACQHRTEEFAGPQIRASGQLGLAILAGIALSLAFLPWRITWLAWVGIAPLLVAARSASPGRAALLGLTAGCMAEGWSLQWLLASGVAPPAFALLVFFASTRIALFAAAAAVVYRRRPAWAGLALPALWVLLEYARVQVGWLSIPWGFLGHAEYEVELEVETEARSKGEKGSR